MKTLKTIFIAIISILMIAASCAKIERAYDRTSLPMNDKGEYAIVFTDKVMTKSVANPALTHDYTLFDVYAWQDGTATAWSPYTVSKSGNEWKYDETTGQELQYFDRNTAKYDFLGVITGGTVAPANGDVALNVTGVKSFENNDNETTTPDELLWAQAAVEKAAYDSEVALTFKHANAKMYIGFVSDRDDTQILDYTPSKPEVPAVPATTTTDTKTGKAIDMLVAGDIVYWPYVVNSSLTSTQPNPRYDNESNYGNMSAVMDAVNAQFVYYNTSGGEMAVADQTWDSAQNTNFKNMYGFKLASTTDKAAFAAGNDAFWINASDQLKSTFQAAYDAGWRVVRIQHYSGSHYCAFLINNTEMTYKVIITTGGTPYQPAVPGINGIRVFSVSEDATTGKNIRTAHTTEASAVLGNNACVLTQTANSGDGADSNITFVKPTGAIAQVADFTTVDENTTVTWSPTVWYALPVANPDNGYVVKFSYTYNGVSYYDARVHIPATDSSFEQGKYYRYVICIGNKTNGSTDPGEAGTDKDEVDTDNLPIRFTVIVTTYNKGEFKSYTLAE